MPVIALDALDDFVLDFDAFVPDDFDDHVLDSNESDVHDYEHVPPIADPSQGQ